VPDYREEFFESLRQTEEELCAGKSQIFYWTIPAQWRVAATALTRATKKPVIYGRHGQDFCVVYPDGSTRDTDIMKRLFMNYGINYLRHADENNTDGYLRPAWSNGGGGAIYLSDDIRSARRNTNRLRCQACTRFAKNNWSYDDGKHLCDSCDLYVQRKIKSIRNAIRKGGSIPLGMLDWWITSTQRSDMAEIAKAKYILDRIEGETDERQQT
jgi:hypothetical protein